MALPILLYAAFTVLSTIGVFGLAAHFRSRAFAVGLSLATLAFFVVLAVAILVLVSSVWND